MQCDTIWTNAQLATMAGSGLGVIENGVLAARDGVILHVGPADNAPAFQAAQTIDCGGRWITPGLIDAHTHLVFAGNRSDEWEARLAGASYQDIARAGGGIMATVRATRGASVDDLVAAALPRLDALLAQGVTTVEIKSGYGLTLDAERTMLRAARMLGTVRPVHVVTTFLGAHALPPEWVGNADGYITELAEHWLPTLAGEGLVDAVDAFCEGIAFSPAQVDRLFHAARALGLPVRLHAEQLSNLGGAALAAEHGALCADHLEHLDAAGVAAMAASGTVAMLLPGAFYFMRETVKPPIAALRAAGVPMAIATDCNPGTSPLTSLLLAMNMGATLFGLTVEECLLGATVHAARALGLAGTLGQLVPGQRADLAIWNIARPADLVHGMGAAPLHARIWSGK
ncbi:imidazolonepropionase [Novosphingobium pokkalii]|uniref:Imidazolonepropionase n=1 Tax=Novosphingobium pokkalii TaxID=1770194 RepID=A0ABV7V2W5_9SPHN|nr:imidazolonepropionase [Novosphingobium pokkalii]GHC93779.1 imidazolonepropionase [Novosphingobium pokkalii]